MSSVDHNDQAHCDRESQSHSPIYVVAFQRAHPPCKESYQLLEITIFFPLVQQPNVGQDRLILEVSRSGSDTPQLVGFLWTSNRPVAETTT